MTGSVGEEGFDPLAIIRVLNEHQVHYVVIGGIAAGVQGAIWLTADLDIVYARDRGDLDNLASALTELQARPIDLPPAVRVALDARSLRRSTNWTLTTRYGRLDLLGEPGAGLDYATLASRAREIRGAELYLVATLEDLISMKKAAGRPKDLIQIDLLRVAAEEVARAAGRAVDR